MKRLFAVLALASGCVDLPETSTIEASSIYEPPDCPIDECGMNTGSMGEVNWHDLHLGHTVWNGSDVRYVGINGKPPIAQSIDVFNGKLVLVDAANNPITFLDVLNTYIILEHKKGTRFWVKVVAKHNTAKYWAYQPAPVAGVETTIETYTLRWKLEGETDHHLQDFCTIEGTRVPDEVKTDVVVFKGDLYDPATKQITLSADPEWVNFACLGSGPAKMFLSRHTTASDDPAHPTTLNERKALLNAWTANYCGDGRSFTETGEPLFLRDDRGFFDKTSPWSWELEFNEKGFSTRRLSSYEAVWSGAGATCIDTPRLRFTETKDDPTILDTIQDWCESLGKPRPGRCSQKGTVLKQADWDTSRTHILTGNPIGS